MRITLAIVTFIPLAAFAVGVPTSLCAADRQINSVDSNAIARAVVEADLTPAGKHNGFSFDGESSRPEYPHIQFFQAWPNAGQGIIGNYAIDLLTGDGWSTDLCREIRTPRLQHLQRAARARIGLTDKHYKQVKRSTPPCER